VVPAGLEHAGEFGGNFNSTRSGSIFGRKYMNRVGGLVPKYSGQSRHGLLADRLYECECGHGVEGTRWGHWVVLSAMRVRMDAAA
jgi:hypothetical protein